MAALNPADVEKDAGTGIEAGGTADTEAGGAAGRDPVTDPRNYKTRLLMGDEALGRLSRSTVMVIGLGGVGGSCAAALARGAVGRLVLVDGDSFSETNLNRQEFAYQGTVDRPKALVARSIVQEINPYVEVESVVRRIEPDDVPALLARRPDYVVDAQDTVSTKLALAAFCEREGIPLVSSMGTGNKLHPELFEIADIYETSVCPLCKAVRKQARAMGIARMTVLYSKEPPRRPYEIVDGPEGENPRVGTVSFVPPVAGLMLAGHAIRALAGLD